VTTKYYVDAAVAIQTKNPQGTLWWSYRQHTSFYFLDKFIFVADKSHLPTAVMDLQDGATNKATVVNLFLKW